MNNKRPSKKQTLVFGSGDAMARMKQHLIKTGCTVHCADYDGNWFITFSEPAIAKT